MLTAYLKKGRERSVLQGNPWIFSGSIDRVDGSHSPGAPCVIRDRSGTLLGCGYFNEQSAITIRILRHRVERFTTNDLNTAIRQAVERRVGILDLKTDSCRLINSEGDFLPGLIVDQYATGLVIQILTAGMERMREWVVHALIDVCSPQFVYERSDTEARTREGLDPSEGIRHGVMPAHLVITENGLSFSADVAQGQKTGFFFDQRQNRALLRTLSAGKRVCDCFCYSGGFAIAALAGGASAVDAIDQSENALELFGNNIALNAFDAGRVRSHAADVFRYLRETREVYDCIILDPPKFARHPGEVDRASRGYKDINLLACKKIAPGGIIVSFSCSHAIDVKLFRQIVFAAAADSGRRFQLLHSLSAGPDHPINLAHKEGEYLKGLVLRAEN
jgi:23S rRNA (cytosine1962-C5)-methyltransferase